MKAKHKKNTSKYPSNRPILLTSLLVTVLLTILLTYGFSGYITSLLWSISASYLIVVNCVAFVLYGVDKQLAIAQNRRIPEKYLLFFGLIGGSLGSVIAISKLRHKTQKFSYSSKFAVIMLLHVSILALLAYLTNR